MDFSKIVAINGKPGLYKVIAQRNNGLIVESFSDSKKSFVSVNTHAFSLLDGVALYTWEDSEPLKKVMFNMKEKEAELPLPESGASKDELRAYLTAILPNHDDDRVYASDIKKLVKWFKLLKEHDALPTAEELAEAEEADDSSAE